MKPTMYVLCILSSILLNTSCKKGDSGGSPASSLPTVTTTEGSAITATTAQSGGNVTADGGSAITARGVCWSDSKTPTVSDSKTTDGAGAGSFTSTVTQLQPYHAYTVRAYATNNSGTAYGDKVIILTAPGATIHTAYIQVSNYKRSCQTDITISGFDDPSFKPITQSGLCIATTQNPTTADLVLTNGPINLAFSHITATIRFGANTTWYIRGFTTSSAGTTYGNQVTYTAGIDIGLSYEGGVIFYVDGTGNHGLIAAVSDQGTGILWAPASLANVITNASSSTDGAGNTTKIINTYGNTGTYAAKLCRDYR